MHYGSLRMADEMVGASIEVNGGKVYDPLGLLVIHEINPGVLPHPKWLREAELKHCRICMLASVGAFTGQWGLTLPGYTAVPDPVQNLNQFVTNYPAGFAQIIMSIAIIEGHFFSGDFWFGKGDRAAGDMGYDPLGLSKKKTPAQVAQLQLQELKNGRLAMIAMAAYTSEHWIPGSVPFLPGKF
ncbi:chlorophyll a/b-binding protein domain-containing protein [Ochromonadaceae sp. CCMP2298]|nr:chlorophyll a/b-binding protein domain-containing protein [Ochromonadaceae sp. CCMP2298]